MNILQVTPRYPPHTGGVETHVAKISEHLADRSHKVTVFTADAEDRIPQREMRNGVSIRRFRGFAPSGAFHIAPAIAPAIRQVNPDIVHAHNYHSLPVLFAALGVTDARFVVTAHYHGGSAGELKDRLLELYRPLGKWALDRADEIIAVSDWERKQLYADFAVEANVIPNGLNIGRFMEATAEKRDRPYLLCVGRLEQYKGIQHVISALPNLPEFDLLIAGSGDYQPNLEQIARDAGVAKRVEFLGFVDDERLPKLYTGASAYLHLSSFESYGMTVAEALASGTPCVVQTGSALDDWTDNSGVIGINDISPASVASAVRDVHERDPDTTRVVDWQTVVDKVSARYADH